MRISDWSSDVCSSDLSFGYCAKKGRGDGFVAGQLCNVTGGHVPAGARSSDWINSSAVIPCWREVLARSRYSRQAVILPSSRNSKTATRSEEHTSELQSLMRISYAVFCLKKKKKT